MRTLILLFLAGCLLSCNKQQQADIIVKNAKIYTVDNAFSIAESMAIKDGKFMAVGTNDSIAGAYSATRVIDAKGKSIYPGFIDAHCHFYGLGLQQQKVDVTGTKSYDEVLARLADFQKSKKLPYITGRGWDQNDWEEKAFPTKEKLDALFPNTPVAITRIDGHAILVNQAAMDHAKANLDTIIPGGEIIIKDGKATGVLIDNAMDLIKVPEPSKKEQIQALLDAQKICFDLGLTTVDDAGLDKQVIELIDSLQQTGDLKMRIYAMVTNSKENLDHYLPKGIVKTDRLHVRSVKVYSDGALGSRGALLKKPYEDKHNHFGAYVTNYEELQELAKRISESEYQMNTHAIGDSANYAVLETYKRFLKDDTSRRWRIEHAQVVDLKDFDAFELVLPSVQPTHATSDMYWLEDRVGAKRAKGAYAYNDLLQKHGKIALGTDFPIERVDPLLTFYAAVARKDLNNYPKGGFQKENALSRPDALRGMTIWAAYANFEEAGKGSIEVDKVADFVILDQDIMIIDENTLPKVKILETYLGGERVD